MILHSTQLCIINNVFIFMSLLFLTDAVCCIVLNEFRVLSTLFTLKANSAHIAKGWRDQIISTQVTKSLYKHTYIHVLIDEYN